MLVILCNTDTYTTYSAFYIKILNYIYIYFITWKIQYIYSIFLTSQLT